jgi:membrane AbrB-like protein
VQPSISTHLTTLVAATAGGALFTLAHVPLAWMIGALFATAALAWFRPVAVHGVVRPVALIMLGLGLGQTFSGPVMEAVAGAMPVLVLAALLSILAGLAVVPFFTRMTGMDSRTGYFSSVPGGVVVMAVLAQREGVAMAPVTLAQTIRVLVVVLSFPLVLGFFAHHADDAVFSTARLPVQPLWLGVMMLGALAAALLMRRTGVANPWMLGPFGLTIALAATEHLPSGVPTIMINMAQIGMGTSLGQRLTRDFLLRSHRLAWASVLSSLALSLLCSILGLALGWATGLPQAAVVLGMAPGGMPEMALTAKALDLAVPLVLGFHLTRTVLCNFLVGPVYRAAKAMRLLA